MLKNVFKGLKRGTKLIVNKNLTIKKCEDIISSLNRAERSLISPKHDSIQAGKQCTALDIDYRDISIHVQFEDGITDYIHYKLLRKIRKNEK